VIAGGGARPPADGGRISAWQLALILVTVMAIQDSTSLDHWLAWRVGNDLWISLLLAAPCAVAGVLLLTALADRHPGSDLAEILLRTAGPLAYPLGLAYAGLFLADAFLSAREFGTLSRLLSFMNLTPYLVFAAGLVTVAVYGAWLGIEVLARVNAAFLLFVDIPLGVLLAGLSINHQSIARLLPILADGPAPVMWGTWLIVAKFGEFVVLLVFLPLVAEGRAQARRISVWAVLLVTVMALGHTVGAVLTFGPAVRSIEWPTYSQVRSIVVARFIANLDWVAVILWVHGFVIEVATFIYAAALMLAKLFRARSQRGFILPLGAVTLVASRLTGRTEPAVLLYRWWLDGYGFMAMGWLLPLLLLCVTLLRGQGTRRSERRRARRHSPEAADAWRSAARQRRGRNFAGARDGRSAAACPAPGQGEG
jgi:spore germination protein KB